MKFALKMGDEFYDECSMGGGSFNVDEGEIFIQQACEEYAAEMTKILQCVPA